MLLRYMVGLIGALGLLFFCKSFVRAAPWISMLSGLGTTTLGVYFLHRYFVAEAIGLWGSTYLSGVYILGLAVGIFAVCHLIVVLTKRWSCIDCVFWGPGRYVRVWLSKKDRIDGTLCANY